MLIAKNKKDVLANAFLVSLEQWLCSSLLPVKVAVEIVTPLVYIAVLLPVISWKIKAITARTSSR